ncbi:MAG: xanthine dehydrogenase family protein subunit M [Sphaerobacteraceae bacterium]|nr:MAG: xanthine dehydrogenase family protein subunit M [Sphaerobacteraceae bacterium]
MYPAEFDYHRPGSVADAIKLLQDNPEAKLLAGGHSLLPVMKLRLAQPTALIDISSLSELSGVSEDGDALVIGANTTYHDLMNSSVIKNKLPVLAEASDLVGDVQVRNKGTIGGAAAHADPASDLPAVLLALNAEFKTVGPSGEKTHKATDFFVDMFTTTLEPEEVLTEIRIPDVSNVAGATYLKFAHPASGYAIVGIAAVKTASGEVRAAVTGSVPIAVRLSAVESEISGKDLSDDNIAAAAEKATEGMDFVGDIHASDEYRAHLTKVYTKRALKKIAG